MPAKKCPVCGKPHNNKKFCSRECYKKYKSATGVVGRYCQQCGKPFEIRLSWIQRGKGKFCSRECYNKYKSATGVVGRYCQQCGKPFEICLSLIQRGKGKFCSRECNGKSQKTGETRNCQVCGKEFYTEASKIKKGRGKFCSRECRGKSQERGSLAKNGYKICSSCQQKQPIDNFHKDANKKDGLNSQCKTCNTYSKYNLSLKQMITVSKIATTGHCWICGRSAQNAPKEILNIDHCHDSDEVRGLLCNNCNRGLGFFQDSPAFLRKAADYLENPPGIPEEIKTAN